MKKGRVLNIKEIDCELLQMSCFRIIKMWGVSIGSEGTVTSIKEKKKKIGHLALQSDWESKEYGIFHPVIHMDLDFKRSG